MPDFGINNPPVVPLNLPSQFQKGLFPFSAFSVDDPNKTAHPVLALLAPWVFAAAVSNNLASFNSNYSFSDASAVNIVVLTTGASNLTVDWSGITSSSAGRLFYIVKADNGAGKITLSATISGIVNPTINKQYDYTIVFYDGTTLYSFPPGAEMCTTGV
jgi:hypothetical protein